MISLEPAIYLMYNTKNYFNWKHVPGTGDVSFDKNDFIKRYIICWLALHMPDDGVEENFEDTLECLKFYLEEDRIIKSYKPVVPVITKAVMGKIINRPGLYMDL